MINFSFRFVVRKEYLRLSSVECVRSTGFFGAQRDQIRIGRQPKYRETSHLSCFWIEKEVCDGFFSLFPSATSLGYTIHVAVPICEEDRGCRWQQFCQHPCASWVLKRPPNPKLCGSTCTVVTTQIRHHAQTVPGRCIVQAPKLQTVFGRLWGHILIQTVPSMECTNVCTCMSHLKLHTRLR